jgi:DNA-binding CsgD family transcriptional regulator
VPPTAASVTVVDRVAPDAVARSVKLRLGRLSPQAAALARAVAVLGDGADREHAGALAGIGRDETTRAAAALARVDLLRTEPPYGFVHPVVRNAVYESIASHEREHEHIRAAEVLTAGGASPAQVAAHLLRTPPESVEGAVGTLVEAARRAAGEGGLESAASYLRRVLEESTGDEERGNLLLELAAIEFSLGVPSVVERLRESVSLLRAPDRRGEATLELARALFFWSPDRNDAIDVLERALAEAGLDEDLRLHLEAELIANSIRIPAHQEEARRRLDALDVDSLDSAGARLILGLQAFHEGTLGRNLDRSVQRAERSLTVLLAEERSWSYWAAVYTLMFADHLEEALRAVDVVITDASKRGAAFHFSGALMMRAMLRTGLGELVEAEADAQTAIEAVPHRDAMFVPHAYGWLMHVLVERGALDAAADALAALEADVGAIPERFLFAPVIRSRAMLDAASGRHQAALDGFLAVGRIFDALSLVNPIVSDPAWRTGAALAHHALGREGEALALAREEVELARAWGAPRGLGRALRIRGLIEGGAVGIESIREALSVLEPSPARLEHAYALADLGSALRRGNRRAEAREHLRRALELAQRCGANLLAERAQEELIATGARPRRLVVSGVDSLTPSERRVAAMAAEGLANRDIAQALFVTLRTVELHLSNAFRKLGVSSRTQLAAALAQSPTAQVA